MQVPLVLCKLFAIVIPCSGPENRVKRTCPSTLFKQDLRSCFCFFRCGFGSLKGTFWEWERGREREREVLSRSRSSGSKVATLQYSRCKGNVLPGPPNGAGFAYRQENTYFRIGLVLPL